MLVALDVSVEEAELQGAEGAGRAREDAAGTPAAFERRLATAQEEVDRARAERDVALAQIARTKAIIARKTIRAPFRARVGMADVHPGQYLNEGTELTTLQGVDDAVHVDFTVPQQVAAGLRVGETVEVFTAGESSPIAGPIVAIDARVDPTTRNAMVRARIEDGATGRRRAPRCGSRSRSARCARAVAVPVSALRKGPGGDHVFVIAPGEDGKTRAHVRRVDSGAVLGDEVLILDGLAAGEQVAASGSFKLREAVLVAVANTPAG